MAFCANCGSQVADGAGFCPNCGKATGQTGAAAPPVPPPPAQQAAPPPNYQAAPAAAPLADNIAGMLAYFTFIPAIIFLVLEPYNRNRFVRFHAFQSLFFTVAAVIVPIALSILSFMIHLVPVIGWIISAILWTVYDLGFFIVWLLLVIKAYQHEMFKLPIIGDMAEQQAGS